MKWNSVKLIVAREIRDQLRDRRTMFMILVLPVLLYPLLGVGMLRVSQFVQQKPAKVRIIGQRSLPESPPLLTPNNRFVESLVSPPGGPDRAGQFDVTSTSDEPADADPAQAAALRDPREAARKDVLEGKIDAALVFPADFGLRVDAFRQALTQHAAPKEIPKPEILYSTARERSQAAERQLQAVWRGWTKELIRTNLAALSVPEAVAEPVQCLGVDVAIEGGHRGAAVWSRLLPVLLIVWAMMGAFYPAVDLCAGEKERGTLETLLSSPAQRSEIVLGKLATIMLFSAVTAVLNLACMMTVGWLILERLPGFGPPPLAGMAWLAAALVPASAMFGASCLAMAAVARSSKEGQYYLMPLMMVTLPLAVLPASAGMELNLGNSLIPITGMSLWLRAAIEGNTLQVIQFLPPVLVVTLTLCYVAIRWAVDQFNSETVLFRESERLDLRLWLRHLVVDRGPTPTMAGALACAVVILLACFYVSFAVATPSNFFGLATTAVVTQVLLILLPTLLLTGLLAGSPRQTLLLSRPGAAGLLAAAAMAVALQPAIRQLQAWVLDLYPFNPDLLRGIHDIEKSLAGTPLWAVVLIMALLPAVCEELAFRGFILSGLRAGGHNVRAVLLGAVLFGLTHAIVQQSLITMVVGVVLGVIAVRTGSIYPGVVFHFLHNAISATSLSWMTQLAEDRSPLAWMFMPGEGEKPVFTTPVVVASAVTVVGLLAWFLRRQSPSDCSKP